MDDGVNTNCNTAFTIPLPGAEVLCRNRGGHLTRVMIYRFADPGEKA